MQAGLTGAGLVPGIGNAADILNGTISLLRGDLWGAGENFLSAVPGLGQGVGAARLARLVARGCSFRSDTQVKTRHGMVAISELRAGKQWVWSHNEKTGEMGWKQALAQSSNPHEETVTLYVSNIRADAQHTIASNHIDAFFAQIEAPANAAQLVSKGAERPILLNADGTRAVKPTGNVLSKVTGVWSEHHEKQLHLTLHFPQTGETSKIITTHEHPFYVPSTKTWVDAENLKVGTDLHTCDGTPARVQKWQEVNRSVNGVKSSPIRR